MGNLIWHEWARLIAITAGIYGIWASYWGIFYRKFFWDFVGGTLRDPGGMQAPKSADFFVAIIIKAPVLQVLTMLFAATILALEWPLPILKKFTIYRSLVLRPIVLILQSFVAIFFYQGINASLYAFIAALAYGRAIALGEEMPEAKDNRGRGGSA